LIEPLTERIAVYSDAVLDHFNHPRNVGEIADATVMVEASNPVCGDLMKLWAVVHAGRIEAVKFKAAGCVPSVACGSWLTETILTKSTGELARITPEQVEMGLGGLPPASHHAAVLAVDALQQLLDKIRCSD
jgi:nitrogen fixation protein NifU and related proteins